MNKETEANAPILQNNEKGETIAIVYGQEFNLSKPINKKDFTIVKVGVVR